MRFNMNCKYETDTCKKNMHCTTCSHYIEPYAITINICKEIQLNKAYSNGYDHIEYPIFQLADKSYLCISYSINHKCYSIRFYTKEDFIEEGFKEEADYDEIFENITLENFIK